MRQLVYVSTLSPAAVADASTILSKSRSNNGRDGITGLLWFDGKRFLQALEGDGEAVQRTFARIKGDPRHRAVVILSDRTIDAREFGPWAMASASEGGAAARRVAELVGEASPEVRATFEGFTQLRRAA